MENNKKRIEYLDAMRGFTMLLVVISHVSTFQLGRYGSDTFSFSSIFSEFRMPLFFFVSGFVLFKRDYIWNNNDIKIFFQKKIPVQIISPFIFFFICCVVFSMSALDGLFNYQKNGYWFTFTLFQYYLLYILCFKISMLLNRWKYSQDIVLIGLGSLIYILTVPTILERINININIRDFIGIQNLSYFIYFSIGVFTKKYFTQFENLLEKDYIQPVTISVFILCNVFRHYIQDISTTLFHILTAVSGIYMVFSVFRNNANFIQKTKIGYVMQYIGRRTLDIYLLHYFFIYTNVKGIFPDFGTIEAPFVEFVYSLIISFIVIVFCLIISSTIRSSKFLGHYLFGQKYN